MIKTFFTFSRKARKGKNKETAKLSHVQQKRLNTASDNFISLLRIYRDKRILKK